MCIILFAVLLFYKKGCTLVPFTNVPSIQILSWAFQAKLYKIETFSAFIPCIVIGSGCNFALGTMPAKISFSETLPKSKGGRGGICQRLAAASENDTPDIEVATDSASNAWGRCVGEGGIV